MKGIGFRVVRETRVNTPESLLTLPAGGEVRIASKGFSNLQTVRVAASRLNARAGRVEFVVTTPDNGATIVIKRCR